MRRRAVQQPQRDARVGGMVDRALALDPQDGAGAAALARPPAPAARWRRRRSPRPPRRPRCPSRRWRCRSGRWARRRWPGRAAAPPRSSSRQTVILPSAQSVPTVSDHVRVDGQVARRWARPARAGARRRSRISTPVRSRPRRPARGRRRGSRAGRSRRPARPRSHRRIAARQASGSLPPAGAMPISSTSARSASASVERATTGTSSRGRARGRATRAPARVESITATTGSARVAQHAGGGLGVVLGERRPRPGSRSASRPLLQRRRRPGRARRWAARTPSAKPSPCERVVGVQEVAVEIDDVDQRRDLRRRPAMPRLDSFMQPSITRRPSARAAWIIR